MGHEQRRHTTVPKQREGHPADLLAESCVQPRERFVEKHHPRPAGQGPGESDSLLLPPAEGVGHRLAEAGHADLFEKRRDRPGRVRDTGLDAEGDVAPDIQVRKQGVVLKHEADSPLLRLDVDRFRRDDRSTDPDATLLQPFETRDQAQQRRLPAPRGADQGVHLPRRDFERRIGHRGQPRVAVADALDSESAVVVHDVDAFSVVDPGRARCIKRESSSTGTSPMRMIASAPVEASVSRSSEAR